MNTPLVIAMFLALFTFGLWVMVHFFLALKDDPISMYKLFSVRDALVRLVAEGKIDSNDPHFKAIYNNVNHMLAAGHCYSGPDGWEFARQTGKMIARYPRAAIAIERLPNGEFPDAIEPVLSDLVSALRHLAENHYGVFTQIISHKREMKKIQQEQAAKFLETMPDPYRLTHAHA